MTTEPDSERETRREDPPHGWIRRLVDSLGPRQFPSGRLGYQVRIGIGASVLGIVVSCITLPMAIVGRQPALTGLLAVFVVLLLAHFVALRVGYRPRIVVWTLFATMTAYVILGGLTTRELDPTTLPWLLLIPLAARAFGSPRAEDADVARSHDATLWGVLAAVAGGAFIAFAHEVGWTFDVPFEPEPPWMTVAYFALFVASGMGLVLLHEMSLRESAAELQRVRRLLSICAWCRKIHDTSRWVSLERYVANRTGSDLTHGICPSCLDIHYPAEP